MTTQILTTQEAKNVYNRFVNNFYQGCMTDITSSNGTFLDTYTHIEMNGHNLLSLIEDFKIALHHEAGIQGEQKHECAVKFIATIKAIKAKFEKAVAALRLADNSDLEGIWEM